jgi:predicted Na+-dependent transporter
MAKLLVPITLFAIMFALGISIRGDAIEILRRRHWLLLRVLLGTCLLVPMVALLLLKLPAAQALSPEARFGIALMALCPSAPLTLRKAGKKGGDRDLAALLQVGAAITAIVSIPLVADLFRAAFAIQGWDLQHSQVARQVGLSQVLPLALGLGLRRWQPSLADRLEAPLSKLADLLLLVLVVVVLALTAQLLVPFVASEAIALGFMALMVMAALAIGYVLSGPAEEERTTVSLVTSMRNPGLALLFTGLYAPSIPSIKLAIIAYLIVTIIVSIPFLQWRKQLALRHQKIA